MKDHSGNINSKIWLIGDSPPKHWADKLFYPLDTKHPAVHNIWTPILYRANEVLFTEGLRIDGKALYVRNAVDDADVWNSRNERVRAVKRLADSLNQHRPSIVITFGSRAFDLVKQSTTNPREELKQWKSRDLGNEFREGVKNFDETKINVLPLLHASVSRRHFLSGQSDFCNYSRNEYITNEALDDYFTYAGKNIAELLSREYFKGLNIPIFTFAKPSL